MSIRDTGAATLFILSPDNSNDALKIKRPPYKRIDSSKHLSLIEYLQNRCSSPSNAFPKDINNQDIMNAFRLLRVPHVLLLHIQICDVRYCVFRIFISDVRV
ncbi:hypothetical protein GJ496_007090 [Pomphorhynchus laevis]|nr:hypothetical protein GJ496_007090 [Pomphorhynchus laevis]